MVGDGKSGTRTDGGRVRCRIHAESFFMNGVFEFIFASRNLYDIHRVRCRIYRSVNT